MKEYKKCCKCSSENIKYKNTALLTKEISGVKVDLDIFYLKICQNCGYTEIYYGKVLEKIENKNKNEKVTK